MCLRERPSSLGQPENVKEKHLNLFQGFFHGQMYENRNAVVSLISYGPNLNILCTKFLLIILEIMTAL